MEAEPAGFERRRVHRQSVAADDHVARLLEDFVAGLGRFFGRGIRRSRTAGSLVPDAIFLEDRARIGEGGAIGNRGPGADHVQIVADHIGKNQREQRRRISQARQLPALDPRDVLANAIDLVDAGAAMQQQSCGLLFFGERDGGRGKRQQSRGSARNQTNDQIVRAGLAGNLRDAPRAGNAALVGHRMAALIDSDAPQLRAVAVFYVDFAAADARAEQSLYRAGHLRAGFARADHKDIRGKVRGSHPCRWRNTA